jgi:hypothetical protein
MGTLAQSARAVVGAGDCESLQQFNKKENESSEPKKSKDFTPSPIEDKVEVSQSKEVETPPPSMDTRLKQSYRIRAFLEERNTLLETDYASSNWSVYQQNKETS